MDWSFRPMTEPDAARIATWRYQPPYDLYNTDDAGASEMLRPEYRYFAIADAGGELAGYCCFGADARVPGASYPDDGSLDVGVALRPDLTGSGLGVGFLGAVLAFGEREFAPAAFRTTVAAFNRRSLRMCERAGFRPGERFVRADGTEFLVLTRPAIGGVSVEGTAPPAWWTAPSRRGDGRKEKESSRSLSTPP